MAQASQNTPGVTTGHADVSAGLASAARPCPLGGAGPGGAHGLAEAGLVIDVPGQHQPERSRRTTPGRRTDGGGPVPLLFIQEAGSSWTIHGLDAPRMRLTSNRMAALAQAILRSAR
ncbi:MAG: hypothetical protein ACRDRP_09235 [Pseudonocardiaceae bacterium]